MKGIGPSTRSLGSYCSTTELHPRLWLYTTDLRPRATECPKLVPPNFRVTSSSDVRLRIHKGLTRHTHCSVTTVVSGLFQLSAAGRQLKFLMCGGSVSHVAVNS